MKEDEPMCKYSASDCYMIEGMKSEAGDCGSGVISTVPAIKHKFIGIDIGGQKEGAGVAAIYYEDWVKAKDNQGIILLESHGVTFTDPICSPDHPVAVTPASGSLMGMRIVGTLDKTFGWPGSTALQETIVSTGTLSPVKLPPAYPKTKVPAMLRERGGIDPFVNSFRKMDGTCFWYDPDFCAQEAWLGIFNDKLGNRPFRIFTLTQAIMGVPELGNFHSIDLSTASAFPFAAYGLKRSDLIKFDSDTPNVTDRFPSKEDKPPSLSDYQGPYVNIKQPKGLWVHPALQYMVYTRYYYALQGKVVPAFALYCLKDETRELSRALMGYTRGFLMSSVDHLIFSRMILGQFASDLEQTTLQDSTLGINPYSGQWRNLYYKHASISQDTIFQDVDGWDINFNGPTFAPNFIKVMSSYYHLTRCQRNLVASVTYSTVVPFVVVRDKVCVTFRMPSGFWATSLFNTSKNSAKGRFIYHKEFFPLTQRPFDNVLAQSVHGDDLALTVAKLIQHLVNGVTWARAAKRLFNHTHTDSNKGVDLLPFEPLTQGLFLQRQFKNVNGLIFPPLNPESLKSSVQYIMKSKDLTLSKEKLFATVVHGALYEWVYHGKETFEKHRAILNQYLGHYGHNYRFNYSYEELITDKIFRTVNY